MWKSKGFHFFVIILFVAVQSRSKVDQGDGAMIQPVTRSLQTEERQEIAGVITRLTLETILKKMANTAIFLVVIQHIA